MMDIDLVVLWVDGSDPEWQKEKAKYAGDRIDDTNSLNRFRDWGLMPYWFRAVEAYLPWIRTIHFVTCGHVPSFLNLEHPKLHHVKHSDFMPEGSLPTFNSCAIEMNIHRIPGLAEHFIYLNDDMFIGRPLQPEAFFRNGLPCINGSEVMITPIRTTEAARHNPFNDMGVINDHFKKKTQIRKYRKKLMHPCYGLHDNLKTLAAWLVYPSFFVGFRNKHAAAPFCKGTFEEIWEAEPDLLMETSCSKFRAMSNVNQWLALWWQVASGRFTPDRVDNVSYMVTKSNVDEICRVIRGRTHNTICINDPNWEVEFDAIAPKLQEAFQATLPEKSSFEL